MLRSTKPKRSNTTHKIRKAGSRAKNGVIKPSQFTKLQEQFTRVRGADGIKILTKCQRDVKVIAIGGNQLTGKSTLCNNLLIKLTEDHYNTGIKHNKTPHNVTFLSAGALFRQMAKLQNLEVGQFSKLARANPDVDITIEYESCKGIMGGIRYTGTDVSSILNLTLDENGRAIAKTNSENTNDNDDSGSEADSEDELVKSLTNNDSNNNNNVTNSGKKPLNSKQRKALERRQFYPPTHPEHTIIIEGRNPAVMAAYCEHVLGKTDITTVYLYCSPREQATRYIAREIGSELAQELTSLLPDTEYQTLSEASTDLKQLLNAIQNNTYTTLSFAKPNMTIPTELLESIDDVHNVVDKFVINESRDNDDRLRYRMTYDFPEELDYTSPHLYDHIIDTSNIFAEDTLAAVYEHLPDNVKQLDEFYAKQTF